jgi:hypothetical protein
MNRREFVKSLSLLGATIAINPLMLAQTKGTIKETVSKNSEIYSAAKAKFDDIMKRAETKKWFLLPIGDLVSRIAVEFIDTPYVAGTLDTNPEQEKVTVNLSELDCVTFFENSLCIARCIKLRAYEFEDLIAQVKYTRYRDGILTDYSSRLHYTSDWILNNIKKGTVKDITNEIGGIEHNFDLFYMTTHHKKYKALSQKNNDSLIQKIKETEIKTSAEKFYIIPNNQIAKALKNINDGDIIAIAIATKGLDYGHLGISFNKKLMHASMNQNKVIMDKSISQYVNSNKNNIGITVLRPAEVS